MSDLPLLWHLPMSHFSEKARWALDWKRLPHRRRAAAPGLHPLVAYVLSRGESYTAPLLEIDGRMISDSTAIIEELERRRPSPPLYPADAAARERALALEDWFDEKIGPPARLWAFTEMTRDPAALAEVTEYQMRTMPGPTTPPFAGRVVKTFLGGRYGVGVSERAEEARQAILAGLDKIEAELPAEGEFLVGDSFSVADLTAAALFYPIVQPVEGPWRLQAVPEPIRAFQDSQRDRRGWRWLEETWRRWRRPSDAAGAGAAGAGAAASTV